MKNVLIVGAGLGNLNILNSLRRYKEEYRLTLVNPDRFVIFPGKLSSYMDDEKEFRDISLSLGDLCRNNRIDFIEETVTSVDASAMTASTPDGDLVFDALIMNTGRRPRVLPLSDVTYTRPVSDLVSFKIELLKSRGATVTLLGGDVRMVELAIALRRLSNARNLKLIIELATEDEDIAMDLTDSTRRFLKRELVLHNVNLQTDKQVIGEGGGKIFFKDYSSIATDFTISGITEKDSGIVLRNFPGTTGATTDQMTDRYFRLYGHTSIYSFGEGVSFNDLPYRRGPFHPLRESRIVLNNLVEGFRGRPLKEYTPQNSDFVMMSLGGDEAMIEFRKMNFKGTMAARFKEFVEDRYIEKNLRIR